MRDAIGGLVNIWMILIFITLVSGFMAFNINYTKAFRVKNQIITSIEKYNGNCVKDSDCYIEINTFMKNIGYSSPSISKDYEDETCYTDTNGAFCTRYIDAGTDGVDDSLDQFYYSVRTVIAIDIPIIREVMPHLDFFQVRGDTALMTTGKE